jgi:large subunit ribosomal protein L23
VDIYDIIVRPLETEKSYLQRELGQYVFMVNSAANKLQIKAAVEQIYDVKVQGVNVMNMPGKVNRIRGRRRTVRRPSWKKAIVTLQPGENIEELEV